MVVVVDSVVVVVVELSDSEMVVLDGSEVVELEPGVADELPGPVEGSDALLLTQIGIPLTVP